MKQSIQNIYENSLQFLFKTSVITLNDFTTLLSLSLTNDQKRYFFKRYERYLDITTKLKDIPSAKKTERYISLNTEGNNYILSKYSQLASISDWNLKTKYYYSSRLETVLARHRVLAMMYYNNIACFPDEKPSLMRLLQLGIIGTEIKRVERDSLYESFINTSETKYSDAIDSDGCLEHISKGIYYTAQELRDFTKLVNDTNDRFRSSRFTGILINKSSMHVFYVANRSQNRILQIDEMSEAVLLNTLKEIFDTSHLHIYKKHKLYAGRISNREADTATGVSAVVISDTTALAYAMTMSRKSGKVDLEKEETLIKFSKRQDNELRKKGLLDSNTPLKFEGLYVIPFNAVGFNQINYISTHTANSWIEESNTVFDAFPNEFRRKEKGTDYVQYESITHNADAIFINVLDAKLLQDMYASQRNYAVITRDSLMDAVAHSLRRETHFISLDHFSVDEKGRCIFTGPDSVSVYDDLGYPAGQTMIDNYFKQKGYRINNYYHAHLYKLFADRNINSLPQLYNAVYRKEITPAQVFATVTKRAPVTFAKGQKTLISLNEANDETTSRICFNLSAATKKKLEEASEQKGVSVAQYLREMIESEFGSY